MRSSAGSAFQEEEYKEDIIEEYVRTNPSRAEVEIGETYFAINQELVNE